MNPNSYDSHVAWTQEPAADESKPETELRLWDEDEWAIGILNQYISLQKR